MSAFALDNLVETWQDYVKTMDWSKEIQKVAGKQSGCGVIYEFANPLNRPDEDFSIADMRELTFTEPHYHPAPDIEIYFVLQGTGLIVVGTQERHIATGDVVVIPPDNAHYTIPINMVVAVVNTPPFKPEKYIPLTKPNLLVGFDLERFKRLSQA